MLSSNTSAASDSATYVEDVFSTYLYTGNGTSQSITNNIDLSTKGGMVWIKSRSDIRNHNLFDTDRGATKKLFSNLTNAQDTDATSLTSFNTDGFSLGTAADDNTSAWTYASWTFRKQPKFFDVVTYSGNNTTQNIAHSLGSTPGCVIVKCTNAAAGWYVWHRGQSAGYYSILNTTAAQTNGSSVNTFGDNTTYVDPTSTQFTVGSNGNINQSGNTYVAYIFAHDAGGFGLTGTDNVISCGTFTTDGSGNATVSLGYEPQYILFKARAVVDNWRVLDNMRGWNATQDNFLLPTTSGAEIASSSWGTPTSTGFTLGSGGASRAYIYIAIRRGPMKVPTDATKVFVPYNTVSGTTNPELRSSFPVDLFFLKSKGSVEDWFVGDRLRGDYYLATNTTGTDQSVGGVFKFDYQNGAITSFGLGSNYISHIFRRAPSFFDEVCYTGNGASRNITHNLGVSPELVIIKSRSNAVKWQVSSSALGFSVGLALNETTAATGGYANVTGVSSTTFSVINDSVVNGSGSTYVAYLFATCPGVSKVGSYTGTGTTKQVDCGFAAGARFVLIKRTDSTGDWYVWDTARGIVSGNDPYLLLNSTAAEVTSTDYIDTYSAGFELSSTAPAALNASGGTYIFLAIA